MVRGENTKPLKARRVISRRNLPAKLPVWQTITLILLYKLLPPVLWWHVALWVGAVSWMVLTWMSELYCLYHEREMDVFEEFDIIIKRVTLLDISRTFGAMLEKHKEK